MNCTGLSRMTAVCRLFLLFVWVLFHIRYLWSAFVSTGPILARIEPSSDEDDSWGTIIAVCVRASLTRSVSQSLRRLSTPSFHPYVSSLSWGFLRNEYFSLYCVVNRTSKQISGYYSSRFGENRAIVTPPEQANNGFHAKHRRKTFFS